MKTLFIIFFCRPLAATNFKPTGARSAFPCFDEPQFRTTFTIQIESDCSYKAISNTIGTQYNKPEYPNTCITTFELTPDLPTYLISFAIIYFVDSALEEPLQILYAPTSEVDLSGTIFNYGLSCMIELEKYTANKFPLKLQHVVIPDLPTRDEGFSFISWKKNDISRSEQNNASNKNLIQIASVIANQWFNGIVSPDWWSNIWLNNGLSSVIGELIVDEINNNTKQLDTYCLKTQRLMQSDANENALTITSNFENLNMILDLFNNDALTIKGMHVIIISIYNYILVIYAQFSSFF